MRALFTGAAALLLSGCVQGPAPLPSNPPDIPEGWTAAAALTAADAGIPDAWWLDLGDDGLAQVLDEAGDTADTRIAAARIAEADAFLQTARSNLLPGLTIGANGGTQKNGDSPARQDSADARLGFDWNPDVSGGNAARAAAALSQRDAAVLELSAKRIAVRNVAARLYFTRQEARRQAANTAATVSSLAESLALARSRESAGLASALDVAQAEAALAAAQAIAPRFAAAETSATRGLETLLGRPPGTLDRDVDHSVTTLRASQARLLFPAEVLARRPDVAAAEKLLAAAGFDVAAARADFYPRLRIGAAIGAQRVSAPTPFQDSGLIANAIGSLSAPILQRGQLRAGLEAASARQRVAVETHRQSIITALNEVEISSALYRGADAAAERSAAAVRAAELQLQLARARYRAGANSFLEVIVAEQDLLAARRALITADADASRALAALYAAMGLGGAA
ncbi:MAG: efflux transporter outer membrane subunit [Rhodospirillaceae bacterium]|nr:efflux transporter outer membrane subunit [Rhodospirillaceae bacterium]